MPDTVNHFKIWEVAPPPMTPVQVTITDQFGTLTVTLTDVAWIANPVEKKVGTDTHPIVNNEAHLIGYRLDKIDYVARTVTVKNQFSSLPTKWVLTRARYLLVPATKEWGDNPSAQPPKQKQFDHYVCYEVVHQGPLPKVITLQDQFDINMGRAENVKELAPMYFGVPLLTKQIPPMTKPENVVVEGKVHLAIYGLLAPMGRISTNDQIRKSASLEVLSGQYLAVPSEKNPK
jgi:hypothetical protein